MPYEFEALENVEYEAMEDFARAAPAEVRATHSIELQRVGAATCMTSRGLEPALVFRRAVGLGVGREATEQEVEQVLAHMNARGLRYALPVAPQSRPAALASWLETRGFT